MKQSIAFLAVGVAVGLVGGYALGHGIESEEKRPAAPQVAAATAPPAAVPDAAPPAQAPAPVAAPVAAASTPGAAPSASAAPAPAATPGAVPAPSMDRDLETAVRSKDPKRIVAFVRDLARGGKPAWPLAAKALIDVARAIDEDNHLGINTNDFYKAARQDGFVPLYLDALQNPQGYDASFRRFAVRELVWTNEDDAGTILAKQLLAEKDPGVARQIAGVLVERPDPAQLADLAAAAKAQTDARTRWAIVQAIDATPGDEALRALEGLAAAETNKNVKSELDLAVKVRSTTAAGYLVTSVGPNSQAARAGIQVGDVVASYGGSAIDSDEALNKAKATVPQGAPVVVGVVRDGQTITVTISGGQIGIDGRFVKPRS